MSTVAKFFVVLNLLLAVAFLGAAATFLGYVDSYRGKFTDEVARHDATKAAAAIKQTELSRERDDAIAAKNTADADKNKYLAERDRMATAYQGMKEQYDILNSSLQKATSALVVAQKTIQDNRDYINELQKEHTKLVDATNAANDAKNAAIKAQHALELNMTNAQEQIQDLQTKLTSVSNELQRTTFELTGIKKANPGIGSGSEQPAQEGKVLAVDNRANVVVISLGQEDGVKAGFRYTVSRGSSYVTTIEITDVEAKKSAGRALKDLSKIPMNVGDDVATAR